MMNVVGRVGNLISQGVLAIAVPFHPFGGAIDVIVVQQRDETFRSTPWHIQFGKFQGVLKGAEKVRITVNGIEADFHMYLDSSGEAYFAREVDPSEGSDGVDVMNDSILDDKRNCDGKNNGDQDVLEDEQSPLDNSVEMSIDQSNDINKKIVESRDQTSEVILGTGSVDDHVLTYVAVSEKVTEEVQVTPLQNHPGFGDKMDFGEVPTMILMIASTDLKFVKEMRNMFFISKARWITFGGDINQVSKSCTEHPERGQLDSKDFTSSLAADKSEAKLPSVDDTVEEHSDKFINNELSQPSGHDSSSAYLSSDSPITGILAEKPTNLKNMDQSDPSIYFDSDNTQLKSDRVIEAVDHGDGGLDRSVLGNECTEHELLEFRAANLSGRIDSLQTTKFEISLCGSKLSSGMGLNAAAEAFDAHRVSAEAFGSSAMSIIKNENLVIQFRGRYWYWDKVAPVVLGMAAFGMDLPMDPKGSIPVEQDDLTRPENEESENISTSFGNRWSLWPIPFRRVKKYELNGEDTSNEEVFLDTESEFQSPTLTSQHYSDSTRKCITRTNIPTTEQIASLNLKEGQNRIEFTFPTKVFGEQKVDAHIYLWKWNARIVISDVDGTITKSDVLGQFMPLVGMDWTQSGVAGLFSAIKENGYQLLYLSARAIVQAYLTRSFLLNLKQDGEALPDGPVVISPDGLFPSLYREVIRRTPHEFKIACLEEIRRLFPSDHNPFYAGFGNRNTDVLSYMKMGIPKGKIFIINPKGEVMNSHSNNAKSYKSLLVLVNEIFPPASSVEQEDFNDWNYWRTPLLEVD